MITDFHTHAFPDTLAGRAIRILEEETTDVKACLDGRLSSLLASMDRADIGRSVVCSIATRSGQFDSILEWSREIASNRIVPFPSVHPRDPKGLSRIGAVAEAGFRGLKVHPYYQDFYLDDETLFPFYRRVAEAGLLLVCHTGFDIAFPRIRRAAPQQILHVLETVPDLMLVTTHLGAWEDWEEVERHLLGRPVYMGISYSLDLLSRDRARSMLLRHPAEYILFASDSPWQDQAGTLQLLRELALGEARERAILRDNAARLLDA